MSCINQAVRRAIGSASVVGKQRQRIIFATPSPSSAAIAQKITTPSAINPAVAALPIRHFAAAAAKKAKGADKPADETSGLSYQARKDAAKQLRRETYERKQKRLAGLKTRRDNSPKDVKKNAFRSWWDKEMVYHDTLCRQAKKEGKAWRIRVAAMVERLPVVVPDTEDWEREYYALRDYLWTYGKEFPEETGFMFEMEIGRAHV